MKYTAIVLALLLGACSTLPTLPQPTAAQNTAIDATAADLQSQLPANALPYLDAAEVIYAAYTGQPIPASSINTGNAKVDAVLQKATTTAPVVAGDVATIQSLESAFTSK